MPHGLTALFGILRPLAFLGLLGGIERSEGVGVGGLDGGAGGDPVVAVAEGCRDGRPAAADDRGPDDGGVHARQASGITLAPGDVPGRQGSPGALRSSPVWALLTQPVGGVSVS